MHSFFFLLPYLPLLLVLFRGVINCCCLCASSQSYRFSITKALYQRMWYQRNFFFLLQIKENVFRTPKDQLNLLSKQKKVCIRISFHNVWIKKIFWRDHLFEIQVSWANKNPLPVHLGMENLLALLNSLESKWLCLISFYLLLEQAVWLE